MELRLQWLRWNWLWRKVELCCTEHRPRYVQHHEPPDHMPSMVYLHTHSSTMSSAQAHPRASANSATAQAPKCVVPFKISLHINQH